MGLNNKLFRTLDSIVTTMKAQNKTISWSDSGALFSKYATAGEEARFSLAKTYGEKYVNELSVYKNDISTVLINFKNEVQAQFNLTKKNKAITIPYYFFNAPLAFNHIVNKEKIEALPNLDYAPISSTLVVKEDYSTFTLPEVKALFTNTGDEQLNQLIEEVLAKFSNIDLKEFISNYCQVYSSSPMENETEHVRSYVNLCRTTPLAIANMEELMLVYCYVKTLGNREAQINVGSSDFDSVHESILENIKRMIGVLKFTLDEIEKEEVCTMLIPINSLSSVRYQELVMNTDMAIRFLFPKNVDKVQEESMIDALGAILGATTPLSDTNNYTVRNILQNEQKLVEYFNRFTNLQEESKVNDLVSNSKKIIHMVAENLYTTQLSEELMCYIDLSKEEFISEVDKYLHNAKSTDLIDPEFDQVSFDIIGKILFRKTNFYTFGMLTNNKRFDGKLIAYQDKLQGSDYIFTAAVEFLVDTLLEKVEVK